MTTTQPTEETTMRVPASRDGATPADRTPEPARYVDRVTGKPATAYTPPEDRVPVLEAFTDRAAIRASDEADPWRIARAHVGNTTCGCGCAELPTPVPAPGATVAALDLDALHETICDNFTGMAEVRQAADALVAEVRSLRAKVAAAEALAHDWPCSDETCDGDCTGCAYADDLRAALATGEDAPAPEPAYDPHATCRYQREAWADAVARGEAEPCDCGGSL